jgi:hypothetical protein
LCDNVNNNLKKDHLMYLWACKRRIHVPRIPRDKQISNDKNEDICIFKLISILNYSQSLFWEIENCIWNCRQANKLVCREEKLRISQN